MIPVTIFNNFIKAGLTSLMLLITSVSINAQLVELNLHLQKDTILIGERTLVQLGIIKHQQVVLQAFPLKDSLIGDIEILDSAKTITGDTLLQNFQITSFKPGLVRISRIPLAFTYVGKTDTIYSPELLLTVLSPEIDSKAEIRDIKPPLTLPFRLREIIPETGLAIGILLLLTLIVLYIVRRMRKRKGLEEAEKALPAHIIAFRELDRLKEEKLWQKGKIKEYYSRLADTMRVYLEKRFNIPAMEYVSSETLVSFQKIMPHEDVLREMLESVLQTSDMVKFAKEDPLPAQNQGNLDNAYLFVEQTKIVELSSLEEKTKEMGIVNETDKPVKK